ncbi:MAG: molybdenum cofactor guanylyltransferase [Chthoniobacterales bacterium]
MGTDKARLTIEGVHLYERQLHLLQSLAPEKIFFAGPAPADLKRWDCEVVADARPHAGPLAGLIASLRVTATPLLLALAVDLPRISATYLRTLLERCGIGRGLIPMTDRMEPLAAVYPIEALALAEEQLSLAEFSLHRFADRCVAGGLMQRGPVAPADRPLFFNLNTPADLQEYER